MAAGKTLKILNRNEMNQIKSKGHLSPDNIYFVPYNDNDMNIRKIDFTKNAKRGYYYTLNDGDLSYID